MSVTVLLDELRRRDIELRFDGARLSCSAPAGALEPDLRSRVQEHKDEIIAFLKMAQSLAAQPPAIVPLQPLGDRTPVFGVAGHNGDVFCYRALAQALGERQPFFGLQPPGLDGRSPPLASVAEQADYFAAQIRAFRPGEPCIIAGYCAGGGIAVELARRLQDAHAGEPGVPVIPGAPDIPGSPGVPGIPGVPSVRFVALFGSPYPRWYHPLPQLRFRLRQQRDRLARHLRAIAAEAAQSPRRLFDYVDQRLRQRRAALVAEQTAAANPVRLRRVGVEAATMAAVRRYDPVRFPGRIHLFLPNPGWRYSCDREFGWPPDAAETLDEAWCGPDDCEGYAMLQPPYVHAFAAAFARLAAQTG